MINGKVIAIDARMIEMSGIGTYIQHLMGQGIYDIALGREEEIRKYDKTVKVIPYDTAIYGLEEQVCFPNKEIRKAGIDLIHFPHYNVPASYKGKFIVTVHDLTHIVYPEFLGNKLKYYYAKYLLRHAIEKSEHIFTVSNNSKKDIEKIFRLSVEKISITYNAVDADFCVKSWQEVEYLYGKYSIPKNKVLLLYVGNLKPHKNLSRLLRSLRRMSDRENYCLLLVGKAFSSISLKDEEARLGIERLVVHTGMVSKEELIDLYNLADIFVFPSLYEGFGIPPLESMACGTPVIASDCSSVPEVVGDAALLFDPLDEDSIIMAIHRAENHEVAQDLIKKGLIRKNCFKWNETVRAVREGIRNVI